MEVKIDWFNAMTNAARDYSDGEVWSDGDELLCKTESIVSVVNYNEKVLCPEIGREAWGYVEYAAPLSRILADDYELVGGDCHDNQEGKPYHDSYEP